MFAEKRRLNIGIYGMVTCILGGDLLSDWELNIKMKRDEYIERERKKG